MFHPVLAEVNVTNIFVRLQLYLEACTSWDWLIPSKFCNNGEN